MNFSTVCTVFIWLPVCLALDEFSWKSCQCGKAKVRTRIVGGKEADPFAYPWTVALKNGLNHVGTYCVGTLISSRHILTAAHCVQGEGGSGDSLDLSRFRMAFGMHRQSDGEQLLLNVSKPPIVHPLFKRLPYTGSMIYDLALLVLDADVPLSEKVLPICLYPEQIHESRELDWDYDDSLQDPNDDGSRAYTINKIRRLSEQRFQKQLEQLQLAKKSNESDDTNRVSARSAVRTIKSIDVEEDEMVSFYIQPLQPTVENSVKGADEGRMSELTVAGWGTDDADQVRMVDTLKEAIISERPDIWCIDDFGSDAFSSKIQICGHGFEQDSCEGDSGSALMRNRNGRVFQVGITSFGRGCGVGTTPGIYTRVSAFMDWILDQTSYDSFCH